MEKLAKVYLKRNHLIKKIHETKKDLKIREKMISCIENVFKGSIVPFLCPTCYGQGFEPNYSKKKSKVKRSICKDCNGTGINFKKLEKAWNK